MPLQRRPQPGRLQRSRLGPTRPEATGSYRSVLSSRDNSAATSTRGYILYASDTNTWQLWLGNGSGGWAKLAGPAITLNTWTHLAASYDGTTARLYINGTLTTTATLPYTPNSARPLRIGAGKNETNPDYHFPGRLDDISIYPTTSHPHPHHRNPLPNRPNPPRLGQNHPADPTSTHHPRSPVTVAVAAGSGVSVGRAGRRTRGLLAAR